MGDKIKYMLLVFMIALQAMGAIKWYNHEEKLRTGLNMQQQVNKDLMQQIDKQNKQLQEKDIQIKQLQNQIDSSKNIWIPVEVTYYSNKEMTDVPEYANMNASGGYLQVGDYSAPDLLPLGTEFAIKYKDGHTETGVVKDRGALWAIKVFNRKDKRVVSNATMRLDKYVYDVKGKGVDAASIQILKWGDE